MDVKLIKQIKLTSVGFFIAKNSQPNAVTIGITALSDVNLAQHA